MIVLLFFCAGSLSAKRPVTVDSSRVEPIEITPETEKNIFSDKAYDYKEEDIKKSRNFIQDIIDWFKRDKIPNEREREDRDNTDEYDPADPSSSSSSGRSFWDSRTFGNFLILLCIIAIAGGIVYLLVTGKYKKVFAPKPLETPFDFREVTDDIESLNIDKLIEQARKKGDYRLATRWMYLKILQKLTLQNLIEWKPYKTNFDYYRELQNTKYIDQFKQASHIYEYVWYGQMPVNEEIYNKYTPQLESFEKSLHA